MNESRVADAPLEETVAGKIQFAVLKAWAEKNPDGMLDVRIVVDTKLWADAINPIISDLTQRLADCEMSLDSWDQGGDSEYWLRYERPIRLEAEGQTSEASGSL